MLTAPPEGLGECPVLVPSEGRRSPPPWNGPVLHPPGAAPRSRRWYRTSWGVAALALALPGVYTAATSVARPAPTPHTVIDTEANVQDFARDPGSDTIYAILQEGKVLRLDLATASAQPVADAGLKVADVAVDRDWLVATSALQNEVVGVDLRTGATWRTRLADTPRGVVIVDGVAIVTLAGSAELAQLDVLSGRELARAPTGNVPWDVAVVGDELVVSLAAADQLAIIDPLTLVESRRVPVPGGPRNLVVTSAGEVWVYSAARGTVRVHDRRLGKAQVVAETTVFVPATSLTGSTALAVHTSGGPVEQIGVFRSRSEEPCIVTALDEPVALAVDGAGRLLVAYGGFRDLVVIDRCRWDGLAR